VPIAAHATLTGSEVVLEGLVASVDGKEIIRDLVRGAADDPGALGVQLAERLLARGADRILHAIYGTAL
jgi:hydroxymethylbilane synthase